MARSPVSRTCISRDERSARSTLRGRVGVGSRSWSVRWRAAPARPSNRILRNPPSDAPLVRRRQPVRVLVRARRADDVAVAARPSQRAAEVALPADRPAPGAGRVLPARARAAVPPRRVRHDAGRRVVVVEFARAERRRARHRIRIRSRPRDRRSVRARRRRRRRQPRAQGVAVVRSARARRR